MDCSIALWQSISPNATTEVKLVAEDDRVYAPDFTLTDANGKSVRLSEIKGKVVLVNFWATWCGGCQVEIPWFRDFYTKYRKAGLDAVGVSRWTAMAGRRRGKIAASHTGVVAKATYQSEIETLLK
ncbi:MAG: TlpA family protein disulfide reductase [Acidobacteria bacterium]|nr:TlpA family protein disulfide reductase [Acidobacteriota bacterium]